MSKRNPENNPGEKTWPAIPPEEFPMTIPVNPRPPTEEPEIHPDNAPFEKPPYEQPVPAEPR